MRRQFLLTADLALAVVWVPVFGWGRLLGDDDAVTLVGLVLLGVAAAATGWKREPHTAYAGLAVLVVAAAVRPLPWNPLAVIVTVGLFCTARFVRGQVDLGRELRMRSVELAAEAAEHTAQAIRRDRARVAREMHDIVAHAVSIIVVQAGAGQLRELDSTQQDELMGLLHRVSGTALGELVGLREVVTAERVSADAINVIARRTRQAGNPVQVRVIANYDDLGDDLAIALRRTIEEGCTNAIKHAPGAPIEIHLDATSTLVLLHVENEAPHRNALAGLSSGNGLRGLRERFEELGGTVETVRRDRGGWRLTAQAPLHA